MQGKKENEDQDGKDQTIMEDLTKDKLDKPFLSPWTCDCGDLIKEGGDNCSSCKANRLEYEEGEFVSFRNNCRRFSTGYESRLDHFLKYLATSSKYKEDRNQERVVGMYKFHCEIGCGGFSKVKLATHIFTKEQVAIKIIDKSKFPGNLEKILGQEVRCMEVLNHPNLIRLYEVIDSVSKIHLVTEWAPVGDLYSKVKSNGKMTEPDAKLIFRQIVDGISYMHDNEIFHRDIKAENVLFSSATVCKVCDFGFSTVNKKEKLSTFCGSPAYSAPELYKNIQYEGGPADSWSLGIVLFYLTEGHLPFYGSSLAALKKEILNGNFKLSKNLSKELVHLIKRILRQNPSERFTVAQIKNHPWLSSSQEEEGSIKLSSMDSYNALISLKIFDIQESIISTLDSSTYEYNCESDNENGSYKAEVNTSNTVNYRLIPTKEQIMYRLVSPEEIQAYEILLEIGVSESKMRAHKSRGMRSYLIGIYRIILHKIQRGDNFDVNKFGLPWDLSSSLMNLNDCTNIEKIERQTDANDKEKCTDDMKLAEMKIESDNKSKCSTELIKSPASVERQKKRILAKTGHVVKAKVCAIL